jgi:hypothetical protein
MASSHQSNPTPERILETLNAYQRTAALKGAIELDLFTAVGEGNDTDSAIAQRIGASVRGTRILCDYLTIVGFLQKTNGRYSLAADSAIFLDRRSRAYIGEMSGFLGDLRTQHYFDDVAALVRKGGTIAETEPSKARTTFGWNSPAAWRL